MCFFRFLAVAALAWVPLGAWAWEEQRVLEFVMVNNPVVRAQGAVTDEYTPPSGVMARMREYTSAYGRAGLGGTDFLSGEDQPYTLYAGLQISIPLASTKERREHAQKYVEETRAMAEVRSKVLADIASLRQHEADLSAAEVRLEFYEEKSGWLEQRVKDGFSDSVELWDMVQKLHEERASAGRLRTLAGSSRYQLASYAGDRWEVLLAYLQGNGDLQ